MITTFRTENALTTSLTDVRGVDSLDAVLEGAGLNYEVALQELHSNVLLPDGVSTVQFKQLGVVRMDTLTPLGVVGERYTPIQNAEAFEPLRYLQQEGFIAEFEQAGVVNDGQRAFIIARLAEDMRLSDKHHARVLFSTAHDGSGSYSVRAIAQRLHCMNQIPRLNSLSRKVTAIRHTHSATARVAQVRAQVLAEISWFGEFAEQYQRMLDATAQPGMIDRFLDRVAWLPADDATERQRRSAEDRRRSIVGRIYGPTNSNIEGTIAALFQGAVEYSDYDARGNNAERILLGRDVQFKQRAWHAAVALAN